MFLFLNSIVSDNPVYNYSSLTPPQLTWPQIILEVSSGSPIVQGVDVMYISSVNCNLYKFKSSLQKILFSYFTRTFRNNHLALSHSLWNVGVGCTFLWTTFFYNSRNTHAILMKLSPSEQNLVTKIFKSKWPHLRNPWACTKCSYLNMVTFYRPELHSIDVSKSHPYCQLRAACWNTDVLLLLSYFYP